MTPHLTVIVPVRDEARVLAQTLPTILGQDVADVEFLLIDGRSVDATPALLRRAAQDDPRVRLLDNPERTLAGALQVGWAEARGELIAKMDAHTYFPTDYLRVACERLTRGDVAWVSGPQIPFGVGPGSRAVAAALGTRLGIGGSAKWPAGGGGVAAEEWELDTGVFSGVITRAALQRIGPWDAAWPVNEDSELASRFLETGRRLVCVAAMGARYVPRESLGGLARQYGRYGFYRVKTARRHPGSLRPSHVMPPSLVLALVAAATGPGRLRRPMRLVAGLYASVVLYATATAAPPDRRTALRLPATFAAMHLGFGVGFLAGCARFGAPVGALRRIALGRSGWGTNTS